MGSTIVTALLKVLVGMLVKVLAEKSLEELLVFSASKLAESTKTNVDDELLAIIKKSLQRSDSLPPQQ